MYKKTYQFRCTVCEKKKTSTDPNKKMCSKCEKEYIAPGTVTLFTKQEPMETTERKTLFIKLQSTIPGLLLPRNYLSYSQMTCWMTNPERFRREYFENGRKLNTKYLTFGKGIAKMIEEGTYKDVLPNLEVKGVPEFRIMCNVAGVPILSFLDDYFESEHMFQEFKTGKIPWTQAKVQKHEQLPFYATGLKWITGVTPKYCNLLWIETVEGYEEPSGFYNGAEHKLSVTGRIIPFRRDFDEREIERMEKLIVKTAIEISDAYKAFISEI